MSLMVVNASRWILYSSYNDDIRYYFFKKLSLWLYPRGRRIFLVPASHSSLFFVDSLDSPARANHVLRAHQKYLQYFLASPMTGCLPALEKEHAANYNSNSEGSD